MRYVESAVRKSGERKSAVRNKKEQPKNEGENKCRRGQENGIVVVMVGRMRGGGG